MGKVFDALDDRLTEVVLRQPMFFVATAPNGPGGHVNVSPKGMSGTFAVLGPNRVAYLDLTGSGVETVAHLRENGRITLMFCSFEGPPQIVRLFGTGEVVVPHDDRFPGLVAEFGEAAHEPGIRSVIVVAVERVGSSCGYSVPLMDHREDRLVLRRWAERKGPDGLESYWRERNAESIDGLPGLPERPDDLGVAAGS